MKKEITKSKRINTPPFVYSVVGKIGSNEVMEIQKINIETKKKEIVFQHPEYKKLLEKLESKIK
jgi:hypothetical protein